MACVGRRGVDARPSAPDLGRPPQIRRYTPGVARISIDRVRLAALVALFLLAVAVSLELARPFRSASIAFDSQVAVLHFERIVNGHRIERFVTTTPKPLLTVIYGLLYALTNDWRPIAWATILAFGLGIAGVGALINRVAGPVAGAFAAVAVLAAPTLLFDVGYALATPWALLCWVAAGLAVTVERPRYGLAGLALLLASLARIETLVVVGLAFVVLAMASVARRPIPRRAWLVPLVALGALPVMCLHDWLLSGDPLLWSTVAIRYSQTTDNAILSPGQVILFLVGRYSAVGTITLLAIFGMARLVVGRRYALAVGLLGLGPGVAAFLILLAMRGIFVSDRYVAAIDIAVLAAAGIGLGGLSVAWLDRSVERLRVARWSSGGRQGLAVTVSVVAAIVLAWPRGPFDPTLRKEVRNNLEAAIDADRAVPILSASLMTSAGLAPPVMLVPTSVWPRLVVDLGVPLTAIDGTDRMTVAPAAGVPRAGQIVYHDRRAEGRPDALAAFEIAAPTKLGGLTLDPLAADSGRGFWIVAVR